MAENSSCDKNCDKPAFVASFLDLNIRHVPRDAMVYLRTQLDDRPGDRVIVVLEDQEVGYWVHAPILDYEMLDKLDNCPPALILLINLANQHNCEWIRLSTEGEVTNQLPVWPQ